MSLADKSNIAGLPDATAMAIGEGTSAATGGTTIAVVLTAADSAVATAASTKTSVAANAAYSNAMHRVPHSVQKLALPTSQISKQESPRSRPRALHEAKDGTPNKQKLCNCKNSRCLELYCECFASRIYCIDCTINCHNNAENEAARQEAIRVTSERNRNAFRPKIASSPHRPQDAKR